MHSKRQKWHTTLYQGRNLVGKIVKQEIDTFTLLQGGNGQDVERRESRPVEDHWDPESRAEIRK